MLLCAWTAIAESKLKMLCNHTNEDIIEYWHLHNQVYEFCLFFKQNHHHVKGGQKYVHQYMLHLIP